MGGVATTRGVPELHAFLSQARRGNILHSGKLSARLCSAAEARPAGAPSATAGRSWRWERPGGGGGGEALAGTGGRPETFNDSGRTQVSTLARLLAYVQSLLSCRSFWNWDTLNPLSERPLPH